LPNPPPSGSVQRSPLGAVQLAVMIGLNNGITRKNGQYR
jgi:hypothetical protein